MTFKIIIHAHRASESRARIKASEAKRAAANQTTKQSNNKFDIIRGMGKKAKPLVIAALAIAGAMAAPLRSDASENFAGALTQYVL